jgi:hypothetical protein
MIKLVIAIIAMMVYNISMACTTTTVMVNGKVTTCTVCPNTIICN